MRAHRWYTPQMDAHVYTWFRAVHLYAMVTWVGALTGCSFVLRQHSKAAPEARKDFVALEKGIAIAMDIGATFVLITGVVMLTTRAADLLRQGWMHGKLLFVVVLLAVHIVQRLRVKAYKQGRVTPEPGWAIPVLEFAIAAAIVLAAARPF